MKWLIAALLLGVFIAGATCKADDIKSRLRNFRPPPYTKQLDPDEVYKLPLFMRPSCPPGDEWVWNQSALGSAVGLCVIRKDI